MKKRIINLIIIMSIIFIRINLFSGVVHAAGGNWQEGETYEFRVGDYYYTSFAELQNFQWQYSSLKPAIVEVLQPEVVVNQLGYNLFNVTNMVFTTATSRGPDDPYQGEAGTTAKIIRGPNLLNEPIFTFRQQDSEYTFQNIILDGGWNEDHSGLEAKRSIISVEGKGKLILEDGCTLQNNMSTLVEENNSGTSYVGGAVYCGAGEVIANEGSKIINCAAQYGGAITIGTGSLYTNGLVIEKCYSTGETGNNASAIEFSEYGITFECTGLVITDCAAINATENGAAIEMQKGTLTFLEDPDNPDLEIRIENNYSAADIAGVMQYTDIVGVGTTNVSTINIETDIVIDNNYTNCTFEGYELAEKGTTECNLYIDEPDTININTNITDATSVGVTVMQTIQVEGNYVKVEPDYTEDVIFANADNDTEGLSNFFSDKVGSLGKSDGNNHAIFGAGEIIVEPEYTTIVVKHLDRGNYADTSKEYNYQITYVKDGESITENFKLSNNQTHSVQLDVNSEFLVDLVDELDENFEITYNMPEGNATTPTIDNNLNTISGSISVADSEGEIIYTHTKDIAPSTGVYDNVSKISIFVLIAGLLIVIIKIFNRRYYY